MSVLPKSIVLCLDGTNNQVDAYATNVLRLFKCLEKDEQQLCYYNAGVGTLIDPYSLTPFGKALRQGLDLMAGRSLREQVLDAYVFLSQHYQQGDRIYLIGYSRGAYAARVLAGIVSMFGLVRPEHANMAPYVWQRYVNNNARSGSEGARRLFWVANRFKGLFGRVTSSQSPLYKVPICFLGAFDTVSSFGPFWQYRTLPYTRSNPCISTLRHAMAIDELRAHFPVELAEAMPVKKGQPPQDYQQVWFAGVHSDIGGGRSDSGGSTSESALAKVSLKWMLTEGAVAGLRLSANEVNTQLKGLDPLGKPGASPGLLWLILGIFPLGRWDALRERFTLRWPNFIYRRQVPVDACVHRSVKQRWEKTRYWPVNLPDDDRLITWVD